jgi:hypothetical protein
MREAENKWMVSHREELQRYRGEWVVLEGEEVISHAVNPFDAVVEAKNKGIKVPYIIFIDIGETNMGL